MGGHNDAMVNGGEWRLRMQHGEWCLVAVGGHM